MAASPRPSPTAPAREASTACTVEAQRPSESTLALLHPSGSPRLGTSAPSGTKPPKTTSLAYPCRCERKPNPAGRPTRVRHARPPASYDGAVTTSPTGPTSTAPEPLALSVVIPCLNEAETLESVIAKAREAFAGLRLSGEIIVADNGSTDGSIEIAQKAGVRVVNVAERGYGNALRHGARAAKGRVLVMGDADDTYDFREMSRFVEHLDAGADFVMGTRLGPGTIMPGANPWLNRNVGTPALTFALNQLFGLGITDYLLNKKAWGAMTRRGISTLDS